MRKALAILCGLIIFAVLPARAWARPPEGITIDIEVGLDGYVQPSRVNPVIVDLDNQSADLNLSGELVLEYNGVEYVRPLELPTPSKKRFFLYFPCDNYAPYLVLRVRTKAYTEQWELNPIFRTMKPDDLSVVVLTQQSGSLGALNQIPLAQLYRDVYSSLTSRLGAGKVYVSYYDLDELEANPKFFARADSIVLADVDYEQVTPELAEALKACVAGGTSIVFSLGLNAPGVANSPLASLCPLQGGATEQVTNLGVFGQRYGISAANAPATLATGTIAPGAQVIARAQGVPLVVRSIWGSGSVTALTFDFTALPFKQHPGLGAVFADYALQLKDSVRVTNWFVHPEPVGDVLKRLSEAKPMDPWFVFLFLLTYVGLVGPLNFLVLGRLKRRTLVWTTIPVIIVAFSYLGLSTGYLYRGSNNVCAYFQELHIYPDAAYTPYQTVMLVFTAERTTYELEVPDQSAYVYPNIPQNVEDYQFGGRPAAQAFRGLSGGKVDNSGAPRLSVTQGQWTSKEYYYQGYLGLAANAHSDLTGVHEEDLLRDIKGSFSLDLPFDLHDCYLYAPYYEQHLGDLRGRGSYQLPGITSTDLGGLDEENYLVARRQELAQQQRAGSEFGLHYRPELLLVGYTDEVSALAEFDRPHIQHRLSMVVVHLPYRPVVPTRGRPEVSRFTLVGGSGFELYERYAYGYLIPEAERRQYRLAANGYAEYSYELAGELADNTRLLVHLQGLNPTNDETLTDLQPYLQVAAWSGDGWVPFALSPGAQSVEIPVAGRVDADRQLRVRFIATADLVLNAPWADVIP